MAIKLKHFLLVLNKQLTLKKKVNKTPSKIKQKLKQKPRRVAENRSKLEALGIVQTEDLESFNYEIGKVKYLILTNKQLLDMKSKIWSKVDVYGRRF